MHQHTMDLDIPGRTRCGLYPTPGRTRTPDEGACANCQRHATRAHRIVRLLSAAVALANTEGWHRDHHLLADLTVKLTAASDAAQKWALIPEV